MAVSFFETMQGELVAPSGERTPMDFRVKAEASELLAFLRAGEARLSGVVEAAPYAERAPLEGRIVVDPFRAGRMTYELSFQDQDERPLRFRGTKTIRWLRQPLRSWTELEGELTRAGEPLARGTLRFDLRELPAFLASWNLRASFARTDLAQASLSEGVPAEDDPTWAALAEACLLEGERIPAPDAETLRAGRAFVRRMPAGLQLGHRLALVGLDLASRLRYGRSFARLPLERRRSLAEGRERFAPPPALLEAAAAPLKAVHFARPDYLDAVGAPSYEHSVREPDPAWLEQVTPLEALEDEVLEAEVVVVGTGAGGAAIAAKLAEEGRAVALIEAGRYHLRQDFSGAPLERAQRLWVQRGLTFALGNSLTSIPLGKLVGGTTAINSGTCFAVPDAVLAEWRAAGFPRDFTPEAFRPWVEQVESELGVAPGERPYLGRVADLVARGAEALGLDHGPLPRNAPGCDGQGTCIYGCPTDAKRSANVSWVPRALRAGAELFTGLRVQRLLERRGRVEGVFASGTDRYGRTRPLTVRAEAVVVACGAIASPVLLADNGIRLPALGRNLSVHPGLGMYARVDAGGTPWRAIPQGYGVHGHDLTGVRFEGFYLPPQQSGLTLPAIGEELTRWLDDPARVDQFGFMVRDPNDGRVLRTPGGGVLIRKDLSPRTLNRLQRGAALLAELLLAGGAREVHTAIRGVGALSTRAEARALHARRLRPRDFMTLGAHPLGTCRMGADPRSSVVDFEHRVHGTENLYVVDGASVPSSLGVNPQVTIMAMALRAGALLDSRL